MRYARAGYTAGHRVALLLENRPVFLEHYLALNALGCGIVPVNPEYRHDELVYQMSHGKADLAVAVSGRVADLVRATASVASRCRSSMRIICRRAFPRRSRQRVAAGHRGRMQSALYVYDTPGSKGLVLTNRYYLEAGRWYRDLGGLAAIPPKAATGSTIRCRSTT